MKILSAITLSAAAQAPIRLPELSPAATAGQIVGVPDVAISDYTAFGLLGDKKYNEAIAYLNKHIADHPKTT
ncbi:MAG TPA: hypothetical protein VLV78_17290 [Thermoanaerobaculia bacterium]|nr:hypothetical protein [Thermoanaerobaculia bacterium]